MPLLSLRESLKRSKAKIKKLMSNVSEGTAATTIAITGGHDTPPSVASLSSYLEIGADILGPLRPAIEGLNKLVNAYECLSHERNEDIQKEVERAERIQGINTGRNFPDAMKGQDRVIYCCRQVHAHLERLKLNLNLSILEGVNKHILDDELAKMSPSMSAIYDSAESDTMKRGLCTPGTRQPQIDLLFEWARTPDSGKTCWMNGMAGTGKTTIAYTVCSQLERNSHLGASFFCSRTITECRQVKHIIPTIAYQLAKFSLPFR
ncbi:hypothetical protein RSOLAG1IB_11551 [Rhizoctonia solani AG-1 IB]|uniref:Nephrocystin 3-like N-terminal domain-containing protein n=1 Tax=Thanatephorus cucumeris (strain AG1-IB / isolate 7/3/14) TaxID=1108050 RepID=A0A0B7FAU3_THACB|nr:hypothetical protein RSOLAG1IB_11551 [Rhizoctonia solani AG-1 IB]